MAIAAGRQCLANYLGYQWIFSLLFAKTRVHFGVVPREYSLNRPVYIMLIAAEHPNCMSSSDDECTICGRKFNFVSLQLNILFQGAKVPSKFHHGVHWWAPTIYFFYFSNEENRRAAEIVHNELLIGKGDTFSGVAEVSTLFCHHFIFCFYTTTLWRLD